MIQSIISNILLVFLVLIGILSVIYLHKIEKQSEKNVDLGKTMINNLRNIINKNVAINNIMRSSANGISCPTDENGQPLLCGTLTIKSGYGSGNYGGQDVGVHGLWPQVPNYGNSPCIKPKDSSFDAGNVAKQCAYINDMSKNGWFPSHEWDKHGQCAGGSGPASSYFSLMCSLAQPVVDFLTPYSNRNNGSWDKMVSAFRNSEWSKYLYQLDNNYKQFLLNVVSRDKGNTWEFYENR